VDTDGVATIRAKDRAIRSFALPSWFSPPLIRAASFVFFFLAWEIASILVAHRSLPSPLAVAERLYTYTVHGDLLESIAITLARVGVSFVIAMFIGTAMGMLMGRYKGFDYVFDSWLVLGLNIPAIIVAFLCFLWVGLDDQALVLAVIINKVPTVTVMVREGARAVDRDYLQVAQAYRLSPYKTLFKIHLPQLYPYIMAAARSGLALIWKIILVFELIGLSSGVGYKLQYYFQIFDMSSVLAYTFAFVAIVMLIELLVLRPAERKLTGWRL